MDKFDKFIKYIDMKIEELDHELTKLKDQRDFLSAMKIRAQAFSDGDCEGEVWP